MHYCAAAVGEAQTEVLYEALIALAVGAVGGFQTGHVMAVLVTAIHAVQPHGGSRLCTNRRFTSGRPRKLHSGVRTIATQSPSDGRDKHGHDGVL